MPRTRPLAGQRSRDRLGGPPHVPAPGPATRPRPPAGRAARPDPAAGRRDLAVLVAAVLVLVLATAAGLLVVRARGADRAEQARSAALAAAEQHAVTVLSYDHRRLDKDFARARAALTGSFADDYAATTEKVVRPSAEQVKAVVTAEVTASAVVRAPSENRVVVLLFVDQTTTSTRLEGPKVDLNRVRMTMTRVGQQWLVSGIDAL